MISSDGFTEVVILCIELNGMPVITLCLGWIYTGLLLVNDQLQSLSTYISFLDHH